jgi:hypothetical protein
MDATRAAAMAQGGLPLTTARLRAYSVIAGDGAERGVEGDDGTRFAARTGALGPGGAWAASGSVSRGDRGPRSRGRAGTDAVGAGPNGMPAVTTERGQIPAKQGSIITDQCRRVDDHPGPRRPAHVASVFWGRTGTGVSWKRSSPGRGLRKSAIRREADRARGRFRTWFLQAGRLGGRSPAAEQGAPLPEKIPMPRLAALIPIYRSPSRHPGGRRPSSRTPATPQLRIAPSSRFRCQQP